MYVFYYRKSEKTYVVDAPVMLSELFAGGDTREKIAEKLCQRCNELGRMDLSLLGEQNDNIKEIA